MSGGFGKSATRIVAFVLLLVLLSRRRSMYNELPALIRHHPPLLRLPARRDRLGSCPSYMTPDPSVLSCQPGLLAVTPFLRPSLHPGRVALPKSQVSFRVKIPTWRPSI